MEQLGLGGVQSFALPLHNAVIAPYLVAYGSEAQKLRWLPKMASGEMVGAIAMTEPGTGSDLQAVKTSAKKQGNAYVINGQKTFITNGQAAMYPELPYGFVQGKTYLGSFVSGSASDLNPSPGAFEFDLSGLNLPGPAPATLTIAVVQQQTNPPPPTPE